MTPHNEAKIEDMNFISDKHPTFATAKFRYRQPDQKVLVKIEKDRVVVNFVEKQRAVTPGQYVVFYDETHCLGGGVIEEVF